MSTDAFNIDKEQKLLLLERAFNAANSRCIVFTAVRNNENKIIDFELTYLSAATISFLEHDATGTRFVESVPEPEPLLAEMIKVVETGIPHEWERYVEYLGNEPMWFKVSDHKSGDGIVRYWEDITIQRRAEKEAKEAFALKTEEKYLSLFNTTDQGFGIIEMVFDEKGNPIDYIFLDYNPKFEQLTGLPGAKGKTARQMVPNLESHWFELYGEIAKTGKPKQFEQGSEEMLNGVWYEVSAFPLTEDKDNRVGIIFSDVTERKKLEREREAFNQLLEQQVKERTQLLDETNKLLQQKINELANSNKSLESFTYVASHDLQEPLRKIQTFVSMLDERLADPAAARNYMGKIYNAAQRMSNLISDVLQYSRLSGNVPFTEVRLSEIVRQVCSDYELVISQKNAVINVGAMPVISAVPLQMHQLFSNLLSNALKYSTEEPSVDINAAYFTENGIEKTEITFKDNGIGFDNKYADQIFSLFKRLHGKMEYSGTGIGLSICKKITEQHGGSISAQSKPGSGTVFTVILPLNPEAVL